MIKCYKLHPNCHPDHVGFIPGWLDEEDPRPAKEQLHEHYIHGGGWSPFHGFELRKDNNLKYTGDPALPPLAGMWLRKELILVYESGWVAIIQPNRTFEVCRMD